MKNIESLVRGGVLLGLIALSSACVVAGPGSGYHEGYYDHEHHRYWHENGWRECGERDEHCH
jgi:hypothetical protein